MSADVGIDRRPVLPGMVLSTVAIAIGTVALLMAGATAGALIAPAGGALVLVGAFSGQPGVLDLGGVVMVLGIVAGGLAGGLVEPMLVAMVGVTVAWDAARQSLSLGEQLGRDAETGKAVFVHVAETAAIGTGGVVVSYSVFRVVGGGYPASAVVMLVVGSLLIAWALHR